MAGRVTILDGGMGRELLAMGAPFRQPEWSALALIEAPEMVAAAHEAFAAAGAEVLTTNSYAVVPFHIGDARFTANGADLAALSGRLARVVATRHKARVAASLPPLLGSYRPDLFDGAAAQPILSVLVAALAPFADLWLGETLGSIAEARLVRDVLGPDGLPLWLSFTLADDPDAPPRLRSGEAVEEAAVAAAGIGAEALLFNCAQPEVMGPAIAAARATLGDAFPLGAYANAFRPEPRKGENAANEVLSGLRGDLTPPEYLDFARTWVAAGASIIGGCCGIGPSHIAALAETFGANAESGRSRTARG